MGIHSFLFPASGSHWHSLTCVFVCVCVCVQLLNHVQFFLTLWNVACQAPFVHGIFQARILEWVAISSSTGSF